MFIEMHITGLSIDPFTNMPFLILSDKEEKQRVPIWIGLFEASAIATELEQIKLNRPMTHDLICNLIRSVGADVKRVEIHDLKENTFFARLAVSTNGKETLIDSRPSDAIAIALRIKAPILVDEEVSKKASKIDLAKNNMDSKEKISKEKWAEILENLAPEDFGKYKM